MVFLKDTISCLQIWNCILRIIVDSILSSFIVVDSYYYLSYNAFTCLYINNKNSMLICFN